MTLEAVEKHREVMHLNDLDRPAIPLDIPDYRDLMVIDLEGQQLGRVVDVIIDMETRKPLLAVVLFGGFLDMGAKHLLVPYEWLHDPTPSTVRGNLTRYQAEQAPDFDPKSVRDVEPYYEYWFANEAAAQASPTLKPMVENTAAGHGPLVRASHASQWQIPEGMTDLRGQEVIDSDNNSVGVIDDWFLNATTRQPEIVVIRSGGLFGVLSNENMVPYNLLEPFGDNKLRATVPADAIMSAPQLKDDILSFQPFFDYWGAQQQPGESPTVPSEA